MPTRGKNGAPGDGTTQHRSGISGDTMKQVRVPLQPARFARFALFDKTQTH